MRLMRFSLTLLEVTSRYWTPSMWLDKRWYCTTADREAEAGANSFSSKRGNKSTSLDCRLALLSTSCTFDAALKLFAHRGECQMPSEGAYISPACGPWRWAAVKYKWPSQVRGKYTSSSRPKAGRIISPESRQHFYLFGALKGRLVAGKCYLLGGVELYHAKAIVGTAGGRRTLDLVICF